MASIRVCLELVSAAGLAFAWVGRRRATWLAHGLRGASWASGYVLLEGSGVGVGGRLGAKAGFRLGAKGSAAWL